MHCQELKDLMVKTKPLAQTEATSFYSHFLMRLKDIADGWISSK